MIKVESYLIGNFSLEKGVLVDSTRDQEMQRSYQGKQRLSWALDELVIAARFGVNRHSWPNKAEGVRDEALSVIERNINIVEWTIGQDDFLGALSRKGLDVVRRLSQFGNESQVLNAKNVIERNKETVFEGLREGGMWNPQYIESWRVLDPTFARGFGEINLP